MPENNPRFLGVTPYLHYDDVAAMIEWLTRVFGFVERGRWIDNQGVLRNAELYAGDTEVWLDGDPEYWNQRQRRPEEWIGVWVEDVDAMLERVKAAGIEVEAPENKFYAVRTFQVVDPEGYTWGFLQRAPFVARFDA
ncbi:MAG TPA: VOC family protein [Bryobacteraceae bacterium]|nr:VOC family protein [Bryobacteraceae bacterium]